MSKILVLVRELMLFIHSCNKYSLSSYFQTMLGFKRDGTKIYRCFFFCSWKSQPNGRYRQLDNDNKVYNLCPDEVCGNEKEVPNLDSKQGFVIK